MVLVVPAPGHLLAIMINNHAAKSNRALVDLTLSAQGATRMWIANDTDEYTGPPNWETYVTAKQWTLKDEVVGPSFGDGPKTVYVKFTDSLLPLPPTPPETYSASIVLDTSPPVVGPVPIIINGGALRTDVRQVSLTLNASEAKYVRLYNESELDLLSGGTILPYDTHINWTLSEGNGVKSVYVVFIDDINNQTSFFRGDITLIGQEASNPSITEPTDGFSTTDPFIDVKGSGDPGGIIRIDILG